MNPTDFATIADLAAALMSAPPVEVELKKQSRCVTNTKIAKLKMLKSLDTILAGRTGDEVCRLQIGNTSVTVRLDFDAAHCNGIVRPMLTVDFYIDGQTKYETDSARYSERAPTAEQLHRHTDLLIRLTAP